MWDSLPLFESVLDGCHNDIDFTFNIEGQEFDQLFYIVDGIHPLLLGFPASIYDLTTALDCSFAPKQEGWRKSIERVFGVLKKKFFSVGKKSVLYHCEDVFYVVTVAIVIHNMMIKEIVSNDEIDSILL